MNQSTCYSKPYKSFVHRPVPDKLNKHLPEATVAEAGLSDFLKLIVTVMKLSLPKQTPYIVTYEKYTNFEK